MGALIVSERSIIGSPSAGVHMPRVALDACSHRVDDAVMDVEQTKDLGEGHRIEIGRSTWQNGAERSVRDRWPTATGGFSPRSSSEVPMKSLAPMICFVAEHNELTVAECAAIIEALAASISRQSKG